MNEPESNLEKCNKCEFYIYSSSVSARKCQSPMGCILQKSFAMEDVLSLSVEVNTLIEERLKEFNIVLTPEQEDAIHDPVWKVLEDVSTGYYRHEH